MVGLVPAFGNAFLTGSAFGSPTSGSGADQAMGFGWVDGAFAGDVAESSRSGTLEFRGCLGLGGTDRAAREAAPVLGSLIFPSFGEAGLRWAG